MLNYFFPGSLEQDGSGFVHLTHLSSEESNDSTIQCDINRCPSPTNDVDKLKDYAVVSKRSDFESSTTSSQLFGPNMTNITTDGLLRSSENAPFTEQQDRTCHASKKQQMDNALKSNNTSLSSSVQVFTEINTNSDDNMSPNTPRVVEQQIASSHYTPSNNELTNTSDITHSTSNNVPEDDGTVVEENQIQSSVNPGNCRTEDNERNSVGDGEVGENQEEEQEHQEVEENQGEVTQAGEDQEQENQAEDQGVEHQEEENQTGENQQEEHQEEEHQEEDLEVEEDAEPSQEPAIIDDISVGNNNNLNDQQLKEKNTSCDVMETIKMLTIDVGQYSMNKNFDIAMTGNDEVKIENGKVIGSTVHNVSCAIKDIAIQSMKVQQSF